MYGHCEMMWSAVCSLAPHSQFARGARPHLYMDEQKRPTPERRRLSLTQAALGRPTPKGLVLALGMKAWSDDALAEYSMSYFVFVPWAARTSISERLSGNFRAAGTNECLDFNLSQHSLRRVTHEYQGGKTVRLIASLQKFFSRTNIDVNNAYKL